AFDLDSNDPEIISSYSLTVDDRGEKIRLLEKYVELGLNEDADDLSDARDEIGFYRKLGDRKTAILTSPYGKARLQLEDVSGDPRRPGGLGVRVTFNGKRTEKLLLDTGASGITISRGVALKINALPI